MKQYNTIMDYIIEQADRYDGRNLQFEQDIIFNINRSRDNIFSSIISSLYGYTNMLQMNEIMNSIEKKMNRYYSEIYRELNDNIIKYYNIGYAQAGDLIDIGNEVNNKYNTIVREINANKIMDKTTIEYLRDHSFELMKGHTNLKVSQIRAELGNLLVAGRSDKATVRAKVEKILEVNRSKAEEIAQTELSRAYNYGVISRLAEYNRLNPENKAKKYWHGFLHSDRTCTYCRPRIGNIYELDDNMEILPAHVRCRCVWLPILDGWDKPVSTDLIRKANMLNTSYSPDMIYNRINSRLGIDYGKYIPVDAATKYLSGDRSPNIMKNIETARDNAIDITKNSFDIASDISQAKMSKEFNTQMNFWKSLTARAIVDNDRDLLDRSYEAIKGVMLLPWNANQLSKFDKLLSNIKK